MRGTRRPTRTGNGHQDKVRRLAIIAAVAPACAQLVLLTAMIIERRWMFALMITPGLIGCLASFMMLYARGAASPSPVAQPAITDDFAGIPVLRLESALGLSGDPIMWRPIVAGWLAGTRTDVPIGATAAGTVAVDIVGQGPHALVAGTTGSGKSVLLQNWCLALAVRNPPDALHFVFLDFKGGSAFNQLRRLPHTAGIVDDLDIRHAARAIIGLERELKRRERLVAQAGASSIDMLDDPQPSIIIVIDEFHVLRQQLPDAIERFIRIASLGRSLGMHLIACTQHPLGQVHAEMKSNMALNLCLRVRDGMQSTELIGSSSAARISPAMPGALYRNDGDTVIPVRCCAPADVKAVTTAVCQAQRFCGARPADPLFTAPLPARIIAADERTAVPGPTPFAIADDGAGFHDVMISPDDGGVAIIGGKGRGKTTALRSLAAIWGGRGDVVVTFTRPSRGGRVDDACIDTPPPPVPGDGADQPHRAAWMIDDADALFDSAYDPRTEHVRRDLHREDLTLAVALERPQSLLRPDRFRTRLVFPTGDRATDLMSGIPSALLDQFGHDELATPGRGVLIQPGRARVVQCVLYADSFTNPAFFHSETS